MAAVDEKKTAVGLQDPERASLDEQSISKGDILALEHTDPVLVSQA
jgi:hypothetical protein